jgi:hypothetical protein
VSIPQAAGPENEGVNERFRVFVIQEHYGIFRPPCVFSTRKSRKLRWIGPRAKAGDSRNTYGVLVGKLLGKR